MRKLLVALSVFLYSSICLGPPLDLFTTFSSTYPIQSKRGQWIQLLARGIGTNDFYVMEVDPTTGALPVSATISFPYDTNYGVVGSTTLRTAAQIGNATGAAAFGNGAVSAQTLRTVSILADGTNTAGVTAAGELKVSLITALPAGSNTIGNVGVTNLPTTADTNYGTPGSSTIRTAAMMGVGTAAVSNSNPVPISDAGGTITVDGTVTANQGTANTSTNGWPVKITDGTNNAGLGYGTATNAVRTAAQIGNASAVADFNAGNVSAQTLRTVIATDQAAIQSKGATTTLTGSTVGAGTVIASTDASIYRNLVLQVLSNSGAIHIEGSIDNSTFENISPIQINVTDIVIQDSIAGTGLYYVPVNFKYFRVTSTDAASVQAFLSTYDNNKPALVEYIFGVLTNVLIDLLPAIQDLNNKTVQQSLDFGASTDALRVAALLGNGNGSADFNTGATGGQTLRTVAGSRTLSEGLTLNYSVSNVTTGAWVQVDASLAANATEFTIFSGCGETIELGTGGSGSETRVLLIPPGGFDFPVALAVASGTRTAVRGVSGSCTSGYLTMNARQ